MNEKSTVPVRHGFPNPKYGRVLDLIRNIPAYRELATQIKAQATALGPGFRMADLKAQCTDIGVKERLRALVNANRDIPDESPVMGAPPPTNVVYGMFGQGTDIVDIGSGNCMKIKRYTGDLRITAVDPNLNNESRHVLNEFKMSATEFLQQHSGDLLFTSWMSMPQLSHAERDAILECDGLHLVPDHDLLVELGIGVRSGEFVTVRTIRGNYDDNFLALPGTSPSPGYVLSPSFRRRAIVATFTTASTMGEERPVINARPVGYYDLDFADLSPKFDGVSYELEFHESQAWLTGRNGAYRLGQVTGFPAHACFHLEDLGECWILFRVVQYRGMVPPHSGVCLRHFLSRVSIEIDGKPVLAPPRWEGQGLVTSVGLSWEDAGLRHYFDAPVDGVITRIDGSDFYCKYQWTVDLRYQDLAALRKEIAGQCLVLRVSKSEYSGIYEFAMVREGPVVILKPLKPRVDKTTATKLETVMYLLDRPTLGEVSVLTESSI